MSIMKLYMNYEDNEGNILKIVECENGIVSGISMTNENASF